MDWDITSFEGVETPPDDTVIWRYLSFSNFVEMVQTEKLRFNRADRFEDPLEGTLTERELADRLSAGGLSPLEKFSVLSRQFAFVSCWRGGAHESMAMWNLYNRGDGTVAIKSTVGRLKELIKSRKEMRGVGWVSYVHRPTFAEKEVGPTIVFRKDVSYDFEKEIRAVIFDAEEWGFQLTQSLPVDGDAAAKRREELFQRLENVVRAGNVSHDDVLSLAADVFSDKAVSNKGFRTGIIVDAVPLSRLVTEVVIGPAEKSKQMRSKALVETVAKHLSIPITCSNLLSPPY